METKFIIFKHEVIELRRPDGYSAWQDSEGTLWAYADSKDSVDVRDVCGVGWASLPDWPMFRMINQQCARHDMAYSSPVYQAFHTRVEADEYLDELLRLSGHWVIGAVFEEVSRLLGCPLWENPTTNN